MCIYSTLFKSRFSKEEVQRKFEERADKYREVKGLIQKYHVHDESKNEFGGIYAFDTKGNLGIFRDSDLRKSISDVSKFLERPVRRIFNVNLFLNEDKN